MPLDLIEYGSGEDGMDIVFDKTNLSIEKINEIDLNLPGGTTRQRLEKASATDYDYQWVSDSKDIANETWSGTQAMTGSYVAVGDLTYTTPNDGISRYYQIIAEVDSRIELNVVDPAWDFRLYNSTDATELRLRSFVYDEPTGSVDSFIVNPQNTVIYSGLIAPNKVIVLQTRYTVNSTTMDVKAGTLMLTEIYKA
jgi:hypothetical protein